MNLVDKKVIIDETSLLPELEVTVRLPMKPIQGNITLDSNFYEKLGREFFDLLRKQQEKESEDVKDD